MMSSPVPLQSEPADGAEAPRLAFPSIASLKSEPPRQGRRAAELDAIRRAAANQTRHRGRCVAWHDFAPLAVAIRTRS